MTEHPHRRQRPVRRLAAVLLLTSLGSAIPAAADSAETSRSGAAATSLFVHTDPLGFSVEVDGRIQPERTPVLLRGLAPGRHTITVSRERFRSRTEVVELEAGRPQALVFSPSPEGVALSFPYEESVSIAGADQSVAGTEIRLRGPHRLEEDSGRVRLTPVTPQQRAIDGLSVAIPAFALFTAIVTAEALLNPQDIDLPLPPTVLASQAITVALVGADVALHIGRRRALRSYGAETAALRRLAEDGLREAELLLGSGNLDEARRSYRRLATQYEGTAVEPVAIYQLASIDALEGELASALGRYRLIAAELPTPDLYDRANKAAADILLALERYEESLEHLDAMVFYDPFYNRQDILEYRAIIDAAAEQSR